MRQVGILSSAPTSYTTMLASRASRWCLRGFSGDAAARARQCPTSGPAPCAPATLAHAPRLSPPPPCTASKWRIRRRAEPPAPRLHRAPPHAGAAPRRAGLLRPPRGRRPRGDRGPRPPPRRAAPPRIRAPRPRAQKLLAHKSFSRTKASRAQKLHVASPGGPRQVREPGVPPPPASPPPFETLFPVPPALPARFWLYSTLSSGFTLLSLLALLYSLFWLYSTLSLLALLYSLALHRRRLAADAPHSRRPPRAAGDAHRRLPHRRARRRAERALSRAGVSAARQCRPRGRGSRPRSRRQ